LRRRRELGVKILYVRQGGWWGDNVPSVCLKPKQFSCWNEGDPNRAKMSEIDLDNPAFARAVSVAAGVLSGDLPDATGGATHYHTAAIAPSWAAGHEQSARIGNHVFYNSVR
jgi:spore germination cell wall hydrolase CwlJ-like protein